MVMSAVRCFTIYFNSAYKFCLVIKNISHKSYCSAVRFCRITSIYQPPNAHIISHKTLLKRFKTLRHVSILSDHHQEALFFTKVMLQYSQFSWYLQTRCCGSISCCVGMCCGAVARCASGTSRRSSYCMTRRRREDTRN